MTIQKRIEKKIKEIVKSYDYPEVMKITWNIQGTCDIEIDENFYYKEQMEMEKELCNLGVVNNIFYRSVIY